MEIKEMKNYIYDRIVSVTFNEWNSNISYKTDSIKNIKNVYNRLCMYSDFMLEDLKTNEKYDVKVDFMKINYPEIQDLLNDNLEFANFELISIDYEIGFDENNKNMKYMYVLKKID